MPAFIILFMHILNLDLEDHLEEVCGFETGIPGREFYDHVVITNFSGWTNRTFAAAMIQSRCL